MQTAHSGGRPGSDEAELYRSPKRLRLLCRQGKLEAATARVLDKRFLVGRTATTTTDGKESPPAPLRLRRGCGTRPDRMGVCLPQTRPAPPAFSADQGVGCQSPWLERIARMDAEKLTSHRAIMPSGFPPMNPPKKPPRSVPRKSLRTPAVATAKSESRTKTGGSATATPDPKTNHPPRTPNTKEANQAPRLGVGGARNAAAKAPSHARMASAFEPAGISFRRLPWPPRTSRLRRNLAWLAVAGLYSQVTFTPIS